MIKKKPMVQYRVTIQLNTNDVYVKARSIGEARKKAYARLQKKPIARLVDKQNTYVEKWDY